ncbi:MAG: SusD/RagB family nutrient-binding outer membrane lipoprotein, partial [Dysgonamonadaceae bacterium]|nr:SusD/RagB family nutrient-binding outer membrane lipoprotein [Dysgonamonadaceae bacterium]
MKRYKFKTIVIMGAICSLTLFTSCIQNFEDYNTHSTNPSPEDMTTAEKVGTLFPGMICLMHNFQENDNQMIEQMVGNQYGGYMAITNSWQGTNFGTFNPPANWVEYPFNKLFSGFYANYFKVREITEQKGYIYAWANIVRVAVMLRVVDTYGPIPYSKMGEGKLMVEYDDVQTVYHTMIGDLNNSITTLTTFLSENQGKSNPMAEYDLVYTGEFSKWIKFAHSLKLRMAVRMAAVDEEYAKGVMAEAIAGGPIESNADNAFLPTTD